MRTALRMVREEQGPDAVILSNRPAEGGIEIVAATDYDESLVQQALRAAAPALEPAHAAPVVALHPARTPARTATAEPALVAEAANTHARPANRADAMIAAMSTPAPQPVRDGIAARARAVFRIGDAQAKSEAPAPTLAQLTKPVPAETPVPAEMPRMPQGDDFRALLARLAEAEASNEGAIAISAPAVVAPPVAESSIDDALAGESGIATAQADAAADIPPIPDAIATPTPALHAVPAEDPALAAMRGELAAMRALMEKQMGEFALERLRGSPLRAMVYDTLVGYGCDDAFAQSVASRIDPKLDAAQARQQMLDELARSITVNRAEPIDDGGVIALVGPTGAGKTTTAAKLAARFAARHRARDVALVTTDTERLGAREQLHAHGRRLGITVCEAQGPEALNATLDQLVDYPLVLVDTAGYAVRDRALLGQILWLRTARRVRSLLVLPANAHPDDLCEVARRYRAASPEGVVLTKVDETGRAGAALSVLHRQNLSLAYTSSGQQVPDDIAAADPVHIVRALEKLRRAADNPLATEDRHAVA
jgi:flagellar biosynthesis protein FlhF